MKKKSVTLKEVAEYAGVSPRTVSNVVNNWPYISDKTRQKVTSAIQATGYRPNRMARSLVTGRSKSIGVIIQDISNPFFSFAVKGIEDILFQQDYSLFLCNASESVDRETYYLEELTGRGVDAIITWGTWLSGKEIRAIIGDELPIITVDFDEEPFGGNHIIINNDNLNGAAMATEHLVRQGRRHVAHLAGPLGRVAQTPDPGISMVNQGAKKI